MQISEYQNVGLRDYQEDKFAVLKKFAGLSHLTLCFVADGHGGDQCSSFLVKNYPLQLLQVFREQQGLTKRKKFVEMLGIALERCIEKWDQICFGSFYGKVTNDKQKKEFYAQRDEAYWQENGLEAGSTFVCMLIDERKRRAHVINLGDSRATWITQESAIGATVDHGVKKEMKPIKGFKFTTVDQRMQVRKTHFPCLNIFNSCC